MEVEGSICLGHLSAKEERLQNGTPWFRGRSGQVGIATQRSDGAFDRSRTGSSRIDGFGYLEY